MDDTKDMNARERRLLSNQAQRSAYDKGMQAADEIYRLLRINTYLAKRACREADRIAADYQRDRAARMQQLTWGVSVVDD